MILMACDCFLFLQYILPACALSYLESTQPTQKNSNVLSHDQYVPESKRILVKSFVFLMILILLYLIFMIIALVVMIANGTFMEMVEEQRACQGVSQVISSAINWTS